MHIFEQNNIVDFWRIRNPILKQDTFRKSHFFWIHTTQTRLYFYFKQYQSILPSFCSDYSPISSIIESFCQKQLMKNFWKFNRSLTNDEKYVT